MKGSVSELKSLVGKVVEDKKEAKAISTLINRLDSVISRTSLKQIKLPGSNSLDESAESKTPNICTVKGVSVTSLGKGNCIIAYTVTDSDGNNNLAATQFNWTYANDTTAPTLSSAAVSSSGTSLVITASETLDTSSVPSTSSFTVTTDGSATTVTGVGVSSNQVTLTLGQTIGTGQSVSVAYTAPASNPLKDAAGNLLPSFGATGTTNSSTQTVRLPSPLTKEAVVQGVKAQEKITSRASNFAMASISNRLDWIRMNPSATQRSYQGIKLRFANPIVNSIVNANYAPTKLDMDDLFGFGKQLADGASETSLLKNKVNAEFFPDGRYKANFLLNIGVADPAGIYPRGPRLAFDEVVQII